MSHNPPLTALNVFLSHNKTLLAAFTSVAHAQGAADWATAVAHRDDLDLMNDERYTNNASYLADLLADHSLVLT